MAYKALQVCQVPSLWNVLENIESYANYNDSSSPIYADVFSSRFYIFVYQAISHILLIGITIVTARKCFELNLEKTAGHAFYCALAFVTFAGEALLLRHNEFVDALLSKGIVDLVHSGFGLLSFGVGIVGVGVKTWQKRERKRDNKDAVVLHFRTNHGFFGLLGCISLLCCVVSGLAAYFTLSFPLRLCHRFFGIGAFILLMISQIFGYNTGFASRQWKPSQNQLFKFFTFIAIFTTTYLPLRLLMRDIAAFVISLIH